VRRAIVRERLVAVFESEVRFAEGEGKYVAFTVFGTGAVDLVLAQSRFPIDLMWELPPLTSFLESLGRFARVIVFDSRGNGASDRRHERDEASLLEQSFDDLLAVLDAAESERPSILDLTGGVTASFAATYPERVRSLIIVNLRASYPEMSGLTEEQLRKLAFAVRSPEHLRMEAPRLAHDPQLQRWSGRAVRLLGSHEQLVSNMQWTAQRDYSSVLPSVRVPTLVMHRRENRIWDVETSRLAATLIPGARFVELPGSENDLFLGDTAVALDEIEQFLKTSDVPEIENRPLATVLFTDIVGSTEQLAARGDHKWREVLDHHDALVEQCVAEHRGRVVKSLGDGALAIFDGPTRAVRCARAIVQAAAGEHIDIRAGLHTGEIELRPNDVAGIAVHIASRISALAAPDEILVSRTVVDLTQGADISFEPRGEHDLKGVPGTWALYALRVSGENVS
jgi:class 3 adenylate cyclase